MSTGLLIIGCIALIAIVVVQIGRVTELAGKLRGEEDVQIESNNRNGFMMLLFLVGFLLFCIISAYQYKNWMLGYGPHHGASAHGDEIDNLFNLTLFFTGIVFILTHIALFWFAWKYRGRKNHTASFISHDNKLEIIWTAIPAVVMCFLVIRGLVAWNDVMADIEPGEDYIEIEATGQQFLWHLRYPGPDGKLGARDFRKIVPGENTLGQDWTDVKNLDDLQPTEIVLPVDKKVRVRITAMDVLHNFDLPHFRLKMDAVPGMPTYFVFTPTKTTEEYRQELKNYEEYQAPSDPNDPNSEPLWKTFNYELACAELCGKGHFSMRKLVRIVEQDEYEEWLKGQSSYYMTNVRFKDYDPYKNELLPTEISSRKQEFDTNVDKARSAEDPAERIVRLSNVEFEVGSAKLTPLSRYELDNVISALKKYETMTLEVAGHTDSQGEDAMNLELSRQRAEAVYNYLTSKGADASRLKAQGYGESRPIDTNDTDAGRQNNRRTEFQILTL